MDDPTKAHRLALVRELKLRERYRRTHTPTGVWRRIEAPATDPADTRKNTINARSLANLEKRRRRNG